MTWIMEPTPEHPEPKTERFGNETGAELMVTVKTVGEERIIMVDCLCAACFQMDNGGLEDSLPEGALTEDGIYFLKAWHEEFPSTPNGPAEYDAGLTVNE